MLYDKYMSQAMGDILSKRDYAEPPEVQQIRDFVEKAIGITPRITITTESYLIQVTSAAAAGALRMQLFRLQKELDTKRRLVIRIG